MFRPKARCRNKNFIVSTNFTEDKWVHAAEIRPGSRKVVHHIIVYIREPEPGQTAYVEVLDRMSFFNPTAPNPAAGGHPGIVQFAGNGPNSCGCRSCTPIAARSADAAAVERERVRLGLAQPTVPGLRASQSEFFESKRELEARIPDS